MKKRNRIYLRAFEISDYMGQKSLRGYLEKRDVSGLDRVFLNVNIINYGKK